MKSPFSFYGGKAKLQHKIQPLIPSYHIYAEPFAGAASTLFNLENFRDKVEILNDLNKQLVSFYRTVRDPKLFPLLLAIVEGTLHSERITGRHWKYTFNQNGIMAGYLEPGPYGLRLPRVMLPVPKKEVDGVFR